MKRLLTLSVSAALFATACGGTSDPQVLDVVPVDDESTPTSLAFAVETTEPGADASADSAQAVLFSCSDAIVGFLAETPYTTPEDIAAIQTQFEDGDPVFAEECNGLDDLESLGLTEADLTNHMLAEIPSDALPALMQLSETFMG